MTESMEEYMARRTKELERLISEHESDIAEMEVAPVEDFSIPDEEHKALVIARYQRRLDFYRKYLVELTNG